MYLKKKKEIVEAPQTVTESIDRFLASFEPLKGREIIGFKILFCDLTLKPVPYKAMLVVELSDRGQLNIPLDFQQVFPQLKAKESP